MIAIIRISGMVHIDRKVQETLERLRLRKKYVCVLMNEKEKEQFSMLQKVRNFTAYGQIDKETLKELIEKRGRRVDKTEIKGSEKIAEELLKGKKMSELELKPFFRLHPPRGGIKSKFHYPKGVLGDNKEGINKLIMRML